LRTTAIKREAVTVAEIAGNASPFAALCAIAGERLPFFLDSGMDPERLGRFSFVGCEPFLVVRSSGKSVWIDGKRAGRNPFAVLRRVLKMHRIKPASAPIPFIGGAVGYFAYDLGRFIERLPDNTVADIPLPEMHVALYDTVAGFDHHGSGSSRPSAALRSRRSSGRCPRANSRRTSRTTNISA